MSSGISLRTILKLASQTSIERYRAVLGSSLHRRLIGASAVSDLGDWISFVALSVVAYELGGGIVAVGILLALRKIPALLLQLPAGSLVDKVQGLIVIIAAQLFLALIACSFTLLSWFPRLWLLYLLVLLLESVNVVTFPAFRATVARWTSDDNRGTANALLNLEDTLAWMLGPVIGGLLLMVMSPSILFLVNGLTYLFAAFMVLRVWKSLNSSPLPSEQAASPISTESIDIGGLSAYIPLLHRKDLLCYVCTVVIGAMVLQGMIAIAIVRSMDLGFGEEGFGVFHAALAIGALLGGLLAGLGSYVRSSVLVLVAITEFINAVGFGLYAVLPSPTLVLIALVVVGVTSELAETPALTYFQNTMSVDMFGRMYSILLLAGRTGGLLGLVLVPWLGLRVGPESSLLFLSVAGAVFAIGFGVWVRHWIRKPAVKAALLAEDPVHA